MKILGIFCLLSFLNVAFSKVDPPNYDSSFEVLNFFKPGTSLSEIQKKYPRGELVEKENEFSTMKFYLPHYHYRFPIFVQFFKDKSTDFFARLPSYFVHDVFHSGIITRYGKQDSFKRKDASAYYFWKGEKDGIKKTYMASCTITCFPIFYAESLVTAPPESGRFKTALEKMDQILAPSSATISLPKGK